ncbi:MAG: hypothetical protein RID53_30765 [Coleofasciculus sp. B1-GNL1-01]|uniref:hypothetical protein n=1 Tax=Coleofasciculus sp. B1-GNL1-01 TaxID=3068484 RepID=UPI0032F81F5D
MKPWLKNLVQSIAPVFDIMIIRSHERLFQNPLPWYTKSSIRWLDEHINTEMTILEYGGGVSSLWWCQKAKKVYTFEASFKWAIILLYHFSRHPELLKKWRLHFSPCEWKPTIDTPKDYWKAHRGLLTDAEIESMEEDYLLDLPDKFDVIIIDGAIRLKALEKTQSIIEKQKVQYIVIDNTNNKALSREADATIPKNFKRLDFPANDEDNVSSPSGEWITSVWINQANMVESI